MLKISSKDNSIIKNIIKLKKSSKERRNQALFIAEGVRICYDALISSAEIELLVVSETALNKYADKIKNFEQAAKACYCVTEKIFSYISDTNTPQGVLCLIKTLDKPHRFDKMKDTGKFLALENLQDPNNMGTILRTAEAFKLDGIILTEDCCDIYSPKVVRGSMGAIFRIPFETTQNLAEYLTKFNNWGESYATVLHHESLDIRNIKFNKKSILVVGNEGNGITDETINCCNNKVIIPMDGKAESLNAAVAACISMWEMIK